MKNDKIKEIEELLKGMAMGHSILINSGPLSEKTALALGWYRDILSACRWLLVENKELKEITENHCLKYLEYLEVSEKKVEIMREALNKIGGNKDLAIRSGYPGGIYLCATCSVVAGRALKECEEME